MSTEPMLPNATGLIPPSADDATDLLSKYAQSPSTLVHRGVCMATGAERDPLLDLVFAHGARVALPLSLLNVVEYFPAESPERIVARFSSGTVTIEGETLLPVYEALSVKSVRRLGMVDEFTEVAEHEALVTSISFRPQS